jgi:hypothetical protein
MYYIHCDHPHHEKEELQDEKKNRSERFNNAMFTQHTLSFPHLLTHPAVVRKNFQESITMMS